MVAPADLTTRLDNYLGMLEAEIADLPALLADWPGLTDEQRRDVIYDWSVVLGGYWSALRQAAEDGSLTPAQRHRWDRLQTALEPHRPALDARHIPAPPTRAA